MGAWPRACILLAHPGALYARRALCYCLWHRCVVRKAYTPVDLERRCNQSWEGWGSGVVRRYSFGLRYEIFARHAAAEGFRLLATDYPPSIAGMKPIDNNAEMLRARFCLAPSGTGWGMRAVHAALLGCVPVVVQHDGANPPVAQAFEGDGLDWREFAVVLERRDIPHLPAMLDRVDHASKQAALGRVWTRLVWREALAPPLRAMLPGPDAFDSIIAALARRVAHAQR